MKLELRMVSVTMLLATAETPHPAGWLGTASMPPASSAQTSLRREEEGGRGRKLGRGGRKSEKVDPCILWELFTAQIRGD